MAIFVMQTIFIVSLANFPKTSKHWDVIQIPEAFIALRNSQQRMFTLFYYPISVIFRHNVKSFPVYRGEIIQK